MSKEVDEFVNTCYNCKLVSRPDPPEPMQRHDLPSRPWVEIAADLFGPMDTGEQILVLIDYFSRYPEAVVLKEAKASDIVTAMREIFSRFGNPRSILMDNGPLFAA